MTEKNYKSVLEDSSRNRFMFYYSGSSVCCREITKDGLAKDVIIASQVSDNFLTALDLQDNVYVCCLNNEKGLMLFSYDKGNWKLEQILNIQGDGNVHLLSLYAYNDSTHIIYAKQMAIANFYNVYHLHKPGSPNSYHLTTTWRKNNVCEIYAEALDTAYSAVITKDGVIHLVTEWYDGNNFLINYCWWDKGNDSWKKKTITTLFKKDIIVNILYDESYLNLLCYTYEDEVSAVFNYSKKDNSIKDFEFYCLYKIKTDQAVHPSFHIESNIIYLSWIQNNRFSQYALNKEQKNWTKKIDSSIHGNESLFKIEYIRNRKGKSLINKTTYFTIDYKNNINMPYFRDNLADHPEMPENKPLKNAEGDLARYVPYVLDELKSLSEMVKNLSERIEKLESGPKPELEIKKAVEVPRLSQDQIQKLNEGIQLKKSSFRDQFLNSNKLLTRPEASALFVGTSSIPDPEVLSKKASIPIVENNFQQEESPLPIQPKRPIEMQQPVKSVPITASSEAAPPKQDSEPTQNETNLFKKIGDFFR